MKKSFVIILLCSYFYTIFPHTIINTSAQTVILADHKQTIILLQPNDTATLQACDQTTWHLYTKNNQTHQFQLFCHLHILSYTTNQTLNLNDIMRIQQERIIDSVFMVKYPKIITEQPQSIAPFDFSQANTDTLLAAIMAQQAKNQENRPVHYPQTYSGQAFIEKIETATQKNTNHVHPFAKSSRK